MQTVKAVLSGFLLASALIVVGDLAITLLVAPRMHGEYYTPTLASTLLALVCTGAAITAGAYVAARIKDSSETTSGFVVSQAFFGIGFIREFWSNGPPWYGVAALMLVIPCALLGRLLALMAAGKGWREPDEYISRRLYRSDVMSGRRL